MRGSRLLHRGGAAVLAAALALAVPAAAFADDGPGGPGLGASCKALEQVAQLHGAWLNAFPTLAARLAACGIQGPGGKRGGPQGAGANNPAAPPAPGAGPAGTPPGPVTFADLGNYGWAQTDITLLAELGIIQGEGNDRYGPGQEMTRVQFAELLQRLFVLPEPSSPIAFVDVTPSTPGYGSIEAAAPYMTQFNTLGGIAFEPNLPEVRIEVAATIGEIEVAEHLATLPTTAAAAQIWSQFTDGSMVPPGLEQAAAVAVSQGLMKGFPDGSFGVDGTLTRAQAAVLLARLLESNETIGTGTTTPVSTGSAPEVTGISPATGQPSGNTQVQIDGSNFVPGAQVLFGGTQATSVTYVSPTQIDALSPAGSGTVSVLVLDSAGTSAATSADLFTYAASAPMVGAISPSTGPESGGTGVTITGTGFASGAEVLFGATAATDVTVVSPEEIMATAPAASVAGPVNVLVVETSGTSATSAADVFTYTPSTPSSTLSVSGISPTQGPVGTSVVISGTGFASGATVQFGGLAATDVTVYNPYTITADAPSGSGTVPVTVTLGGTTASSSNAVFTYTYA